MNPLWIKTTNKTSYFRQSIELLDNFTEASVKIYAKDAFNLYINSKIIDKEDNWINLQGYNVFSYLKKGRNVIAVEVINNTATTGGFMMDTSIKFHTGNEEHIITNHNWLTSQEYFKNWQKIEFNDSFWNKVDKTNVKSFKEIPWALPKKSSEPKPKFKLVTKNIFPVTKIKRKNKNNSSFILDFEKERAGFLEIKIASCGSGKITIQYGESLKEVQKRPNNYLYRYQEDKIILERFSKKWISPKRHAFRYVKLVFQNCSDKVLIKSITLKSSVYPVKYAGHFSCSDKLLNKIWQTGRYTAHLCMKEYYEDGPKRDRLCYPGDLRIQALVNYYLFGDKELIKHSLKLLSHYQFENGTIPHHVPPSGKEDKLVSVDYVAWYIISMYEYYFYSGDRIFVKTHYKSIKKATEWFLKNRDKYGLFHFSYPNNYELISDFFSGGNNQSGEKTYIQCLFYKILTDSSVMAKIAGDFRNTQRYLNISKKVKESLVKRLWPKNKNAFVEYRNGSHISDTITQDGNSLAVLFDITNRQQSKYILNYLKNNLWMKYGSFRTDKYQRKENMLIIWLNFNQIEAHFIAGFTENALKLLRRVWGELIKRGATTFWENFPVNKNYLLPAMSMCHAWSTGVCYSLQANVLGIKPAAPGFKKFSVIPKLAGLKWVKGSVLCPHGLISVYCKINKYSLREFVHIPEGTTGDIAVPGLYFNKIYLNNKLVWDKLGIKSKTDGIAAIYEKENYIYFVIDKSGMYKFIAAL
ncbi:MAG: hypothetical protein A2252_06805 [Elusimicrobia bacterium RIFOXYA2_FULL_39_19]|nr:MAG: hypothetical protein A2252_06805 [Elusimicrobia bacterium RIFOXYA2_FULL_39_19]